VVLSLGNGSFAAPLTVTPAVQFSSEFEVGDVNGDHAPDVVVAWFSGGSAVLQVLYNDGSGALSVATPPASSGALWALTDIAITDLDGDGAGEVVFADQTDFCFSHEYAGPAGGGTLNPAQLLDFAATNLEAADMDGDGWTDMAFHHIVRVGLLLGQGDGTLDVAPRLPDFFTTRAVAADFDGDGRDDLAGTLYSPADPLSFSVVLSQPGGGFGSATAVPAGGFVSELTAGELDGDAAPDVIVFVGGKGIGVLRGLGDGTFAPPQFHAVLSTQDVQLADVTLDGMPDVILSHASSGLGVLPGRPGGHLAAPVVSAAPVGASLYRMLLGDIDGDGDPDAVANSVGDFDGLVTFRGTGAPAFEPGVKVPQSSGGGDTPIALGDLDRDGDLDLVQHRNSAGIVHWVNDGTGAFTDNGYYVAHPVEDLAIADVNGDGQGDIVGAGVRLSLGSAGFAAPLAGPVEGAPGDFDGDGDVDFFSQGRVFLNALF